MSDDDNVVMFPASASEPASLEAARERVEAIREAFVEAASEEVMGWVIESLERAGFDLFPEDVDTTKDVYLVHLALKSLMMKTRGMDHPLQGVALDAIVVDEEDGYVYMKATENCE